MRKNLDPWNMLDKTRKSTCCEGARDKVDAYDHTGAIIWKCQKCGWKTGWEY